MTYLSVVCRFCGASIGKRCMRSDGKQMESPHKVRLDDVNRWMTKPKDAGSKEPTA